MNIAQKISISIWFLQGKGVVTTYWLLGENKPGQKDALPSPSGSLNQEQDFFQSPRDKTAGLKSFTDEQCEQFTQHSSDPCKEFSYSNESCESTNIQIDESPASNSTEAGLQDCYEPENISKVKHNSSDNQVFSKNSMDDLEITLESGPTLQSPALESNHTHPPVQLSLSSPASHINNPSMVRDEPESTSSRNRRSLTRLPTDLQPLPKGYDQTSPVNPWEENSSPKSPLISSLGDLNERLRHSSGLTRNSLRKVTFTAENESSTPLLVNSKTNSIA